MNNIEITHLVVNGCSWTYCQGLDKPKDQGWPALVAEELGVPVVNIAVPGSGNDAIFRRSYEYVYQNLPTGSSPLFLIFWSQYWRREAWCEFDGSQEIKDYRGIHPSLKKNEHEMALMAHWSEEDFLRKTLLYKLSTINLFKSLNIPFFMADFFGNEDIPDVCTEMKRALEHEKCHLNLDKDTMQLIDSYPKLPCGHDGVQAQKETAKWWMLNIRSWFQNIEVIHGTTFLTLDHYHLQKENQFNAWK